MDLQSPTHVFPTLEEAVVGLRAARTLAHVDGELSVSEERWLDACRQALEIPNDIDVVSPISPEEVVARIVAPHARERIVQAMILTALVDERATKDEAELVERFAAALGVRDPRVANLRQVAQGQVKRLFFDLARRSFARPVFEKALRDNGIAGLWRIVGPMMGMAKDVNLARRYLDLGALPANTLGRAYFEFIVRNELGFPGEGIVPESGVWHDLTHVLAGYETDPAGEVQVVSFIAGYRKEDPFFWLFTIALQFHLGIKVSPYSPGLRGHFEPAIVLRAFARGASLERDLSEGWDYWRDLPRPLEDVRAELGVPPP